MRKLIAAINQTLDGFCDHTHALADAELHDHYTELLKSSGTLLYGRVTYQMMESFWPTLVKNPSGEKDMDDFANAIQNIEKVVFSNTLKSVSWENSRLAIKSIEQEVRELKKGTGKDIAAGSPSMIAALTKLNLIDEYQLCIHPVIAGSGLVLFKNLSEKVTLKLIKTKTFQSTGAVIHYYNPI
ncbi:MAG TPA: dihydrofolate reductase family protein [Cyclobacteriaceae bacterium]|nr:dihydrofolate reductase family protein [Cyclobacteriaceae bacterium]